MWSSPTDERQEDSTQTWRGIPTAPNHQEMFTIGFSNVNGLSTGPHSSLSTSLKDLANTLKFYNVSLMGLSEHHLAVNFPGVAEKIHNFERQSRASLRVKCYLNSSQEIPNGHHRLMGGTGLIALEKTIGRITSKGYGGDQLGRWTYVHLHRADHRILTVISIYQVCHTPTNRLGGTAWHQQRRALDQQQRQTEHPRDAFIHDLKHFITTLQQKDHDIIVGGDWNETLNSPNSKVMKLCTEHGLVDPWLHLHPNQADFATHERGSHRIDSVLISQSLLPMVESISYSPVGMIQNNDHRTILLQMSMTKVFGKTSISLTKLHERSVRSNDKQAVTKFTEAMYDHLAANSVFQRSKLLEDIGEFNALVENIDGLIGQASDHAENQCCKRRPEWFSIPLTKQRLTVAILRHLIRGRSKSINRLPVTKRKLAMLNSEITVLPEDEEELQILYNEQKYRLNEMKNTSQQLRLTLAKEQDDSDTFKKIRKHEIALSTWKTISFLKSTETTSMIDRLEIPDDWPPPFTLIEPTTTLSNPKEANSWRTITDPPAIEYYLLLRNRFHFGQAHGSPFTVGSLQHDISWAADSPQSEMILEGTYIPQEQVPDICNEVIQACQRRTDNPIISAELSYESFRGKMRKWRESTVTSPSGRHLGRYKALFNKGIYTPDDEQYETFCTKQQEIAKLILRVINYCIQNGYVLQRWLTVVNTMICKEPGNFKIHRLRVLHLYEADFNLLMGVKWRELIMKGDQLRLINEQQYGARPGCEANSLALYEELRTDISYTTRRTLISVDNDADSCFDRMVPSLISLNNRSFGLPVELSRLHGNALLTMKYHLRSPNGLSPSSYQHTIDYPIYGTGQGSGNSPVLWMLMSATLFDIYDDMAHGSVFQDPSGSRIVNMSITGFVDDTNSCINEWRPQHDVKYNTLYPKLQNDAQMWADLVFASGGKLELSKCSIHHLTFRFEADGTPQVCLDDTPSISLQDPQTKCSIELRTFNCHTPHKTLGHWKAPAGNSRTQLLHIQNKIKVVNLRIATSSLSRYGARLAYHAIVVASLRYVLPQCHFDQRELRRAEKTGMARLISKCGFSSKTPHALIYAPRAYGGGGFIHWDIIQGIGQIQLFLKHWRTDTDISNALRIDLAWCQWHSGLSRSILIDTATAIHTEARWLPSLRQALNQFQAVIHTEPSFVVPPERHMDKYLMEIAYAHPTYTATDIRIINYCRLYLHATMLSEILDADGERILPLMLKCERPPWFDKNLNLIIQQRPSKYQIRTRWVPFCHYAQRQSQVPGPWLGNTSLRLQRECYATNGTPCEIYHWHRGCYWKCSPLRRAGPRLQMQLLSPTTWTPPKDSFTAPFQTSAKFFDKVYAPSTSIHARTIYQQPEVSCLVPTPNATAHQGFARYAADLPVFVQEMLSHIRWSLDPHTCAQVLKDMSSDTPVFVVTDGSSIEGCHMSYGGVLGTCTGVILARFSGKATGIPSSHRAEATGILAGAIFLTHLATYNKTTFPDLSVIAYCDNQSVIRRLSERNSYEKIYPNSTLKPDWDMIEATIHQYRSMVIRQFSFEWVRGHQDSCGDSSSALEIPAMYNIEADALASSFPHAADAMTCNQKTPLLTTTGCLLEVQGVSIHGQYTRHLQHVSTERELSEYMFYKHGWDKTIWDNVDWPAFHMAARSYKSTEVHLLKLVHDKLPFRTHTARFQPWVPSNCHYCMSPDTMDHLQCSTCNPQSHSFRKEVKAGIAAYMESRKAPRAFTQMFLDALDFWFDSSLSVPLARSLCFPHQQDIGWRLFSRGFLSLSWRRTLDEMSNARVTMRVNSQATTSSQSIKIIAGAIKLMWLSLGKLWLSHLSAIHQSPEPTSTPAISQPLTSPTSPVTANDMKNQIRWMHTFQNHLTPMYSHYFHEKVEDYLSTATSAQMVAYITQYLPAIQSAQRALNGGPANPVQEAVSQFSTNDATVPHNTEQDDRPTHDTHISGEPAHRKRNRRRFGSRLRQTILTWFQPRDR